MQSCIIPSAEKQHQFIKYKNVGIAVELD